MDKIGMKDWVLGLEEVLGNKLQKWTKHRVWDNGESVQRHWQYELTHIKIDIFWEDKKELVVLEYSSPRIGHTFKWHGLTDNTLNKIMDRVGNLAQVTMHPVIDPTDPKD